MPDEIGARQAGNVAGTSLPRAGQRGAGEKPQRLASASSPRTRGPITTDVCLEHIASKTLGRGVWVPAFAGTTDRVAHPLSIKVPRIQFSNSPPFTATASRSHAIRASFTGYVPPSNIRGRRECRALDAPAALCAMVERAHKRSHHGHTGNARHSPRNGFNGFLRALLGDRACLPPSSVELPPPT
jgi:hypothetical protein